MRSLFAELAPKLGLRRLLLYSSGLMILFAAALALLRTRNSANATSPHLAVVATWRSNDKQVVKFRIYPPAAEILNFDLVPASSYGRIQPATTRVGGDVFPDDSASGVNLALHLVEGPQQTADLAGRPTAYTPRSYTVAYSPTEATYRLRVMVGFQQKGMVDYLQRLRACWEQKSLEPLGRKSLEVSVFVTTGPISNACLQVAGFE